MKSETDKKIRTKAARETFQNLVISSLNALGPLGSVFSATISNYLTSKRMAHIKDVLDAMNNRFDNLPQENIEAILGSDQFLHLFITAIEKAQKEHREEKRKCYGVMLANMACNAKFEYDLFDHFLSLLTEISDMHMALIIELSKNGVQGKDDSDWTGFPKLVDGCSEISPTPAKEMISSALQKLASYGIIKTKGMHHSLSRVNPVGLWNVSSYSITPTGIQFVKFLKGYL